MKGNFDSKNFTQSVLAPDYNCDVPVHPKLEKAFQELTKQGFIAWANNWCCQSCGWGGIPEGSKNVVFYHEQDAQGMIEDGELYLAWSGNGQAIVDALTKEGLTVKWDGKESTRVLVKLGPSWIWTDYKLEDAYEDDDYDDGDEYLN